MGRNGKQESYSQGNDTWSEILNGKIVIQGITNFPLNFKDHLQVNLQ